MYESLRLKECRIKSLSGFNDCNYSGSNAAVQYEDFQQLLIDEPESLIKLMKKEEMVKIVQQHRFTGVIML